MQFYFTVTNNDFICNDFRNQGDILESVIKLQNLTDQEKLECLVILFYLSLILASGGFIVIQFLSYCIETAGDKEADKEARENCKVDPNE